MQRWHLARTMRQKQIFLTEFSQMSFHETKISTTDPVSSFVKKSVKNKQKQHPQQQQKQKQKQDKARCLPLNRKDKRMFRVATDRSWA